MLHPLHTFKLKKMRTPYDQSLAVKAAQNFLAAIPEDIELFYQAVRAYGMTMYTRALELSGKKRFLDKTPRYYLIIPELLNTFPDARYIILLRNPMAVLSSVLKTWFYNEPAALKAKSNYRDMTEGPRALIEGIEMLKDKAAIVYYENLVSAPNRCISNLCKFLEIDFDENMLDYGQRPPPMGQLGDQIGVFKHARPVADEINKWTTNLSRPELRTFATEYLRLLGPETVARLGYDFTLMESMLRTSTPTAEAPSGQS